jgi:hypothetical protein
MALNWRSVDMVPQLGCAATRRACVPLQLQLLGCTRAAGAAGGDGSVSSCSSGAVGSPAAGRNTGLQELSLLCPDWLSDDELAAAAAALPALRRLSIEGCDNMRMNRVQGLSGAGLAAFTACRRLRHIELPHGAELEGQHLVAQLPRLTSLTSVKLREGLGVGSSTVTQLQAAFQAENGRHLSVIDHTQHVTVNGRWFYGLNDSAT